MGRVTTNNTELSYAKELTEWAGSRGLGFLPAAAGDRPDGWQGTWPVPSAPTSPEFTLLEPNDITSFGAEITTTPRNPISPTRQRRKGAVTDLDSSAEFEHDATYGLMEEFIPPFLFSSRTNDDLTVRPSAVVGDGYTVSSFPTDERTNAGSLWSADGFGISANNGLKVAASDTTAPGNKINVAGLTAEGSPPAGARLRYTGQRVAASNITSITTPTSAGLAVITTGASGPDWTKVGLTRGQTIAAAVDANNILYGRVASDPTARVLSLDKASVIGTVDGSMQTDFLFGGFVKNVPTGDSQYLDRSFTIEAVWNNLANPGPGDEYEYSKGNYCNSLAFNLAGQSLATATVGFIGTDTETPTTTRVTGATPKVPAPRTNALNTTADVARLRINQLDNTGLTTDFDSMTITLNNNVSPEKVIGSLAAAYTNFGNFEVDIEADVIFTSSGVISAVRNNTTVTMDFILNNDQGAVAFDIPAMTLGLGGRNLPRDESVTLSTTAQAFGDPVFNASLMVSFIPYLP